MKDSITIHPIGHVSSTVTNQIDEGWGQVTSLIEVLPPHRQGLIGLDQFSHVIVVTFLHQAGFDPHRHLRRRPRGLASMPEVGIFAQRAKDRPNPIGITAVPIVKVLPEAIEVRGLDAIHGTPVLDLKPYYPAYDLVRGASVPEWVDRLMAGYF
ncbi:MAG: tRNA (N6-threonylcarbamoyladenosine(37)-N6)-methyltransferase TrmO [Verrucomicrobiota bacterium]|jgi:tRNA-Thr(GGU) m(6)t(6)A37 methyltransferase TsaA